MAATRRTRKSKKPLTFTDAARARTDLLLQDLLARAEQELTVDRALRSAYDADKKASRTGDTFSQWRKLRLTQVAAAWVLSCTFVRTLEDRSLVARPRLADPHGAAEDSERQFYGLFPFLDAPDYLLATFRELARFPGLRDVFDARHNPVWRLAPSAEACRALLAFFRERPEDGAGSDLTWSFAVPASAPDADPADTRFLGDLYQDLNTDVQKRYALLQTPDFVEELILEETLDPALAKFGLEATKVLDPTCGSGHFLLGAFQKLFAAWREAAPGLETRECAQRALAQVYGADINPFAVAIARFRLVLAANVAAEEERLDVEGGAEWHARLCVCNSLLPFEQGDLLAGMEGDEPRAGFAFTDHAGIGEVFGTTSEAKRYEAVVGNPPYITEKDAVIRDRVRKAFASAAGKYALAAPFTEQFFRLAVGDGFVGMINSNAWTKREFGKALIEEVLPKYRLNLVVDTSGAYIPGHGTPTLLVFGQNAPAREAPVRTVQGKRGEPSTPERAEEGLVWTSIREHRGDVGHEDDFVSVVETPRETFSKHPWSLGGGGASELKERLEQQAATTLGSCADSIGITAFTLEDDLFLLPASAATRKRIEADYQRPMVEGDIIRDWSTAECSIAAFPYTKDFEPISDDLTLSVLKHLWHGRSMIAQNKMFGGKTKVETGLNWFEFGRLTRDKLRTPLSIAFAFVATHNHFVLDRGGKVFKQSAPVIKLKPDATEDDHLALLGLLNSSVACFWMKQVFYPKASSTGDVSTEKGKAESNRYEFAGTGLAEFPIPAHSDSSLLRIAQQLDDLASSLKELDPLVVIGQDCQDSAGLKRRVSAAIEEHSTLRQRMNALQEELDWECYALFGLPGSSSGSASSVVDAPDFGIEPHHRPGFWDAGPPSDLPLAASSVYAARYESIRKHRELALLESPVFKRLWLGRQGVFGHNRGDYSSRIEDALRTTLLRRLESTDLWPDPDSPSLRPLTLTELADRAGNDPEFLAVATDLKGSDTFDVEQLVAELALPEAVPVQSACRYKPAGLDKRRDWEHTWELQRMEDRGEDPGEIPVPPKYKSSDFLKPHYWRNRGKLDVPKETFLLYAHCATGPAPGQSVLGWAGWDHLQQARALATLYQARKDGEGWDATQLTPLLVALHELVPWVEQWHNEPDPVHGTRNGEAFRAFLEEEMRGLGLSEQDLVDWRPPAKGKGRKKAGKQKAEPDGAD